MILRFWVVLLCRSFWLWIVDVLDGGTGLCVGVACGFWF